MFIVVSFPQVVAGKGGYAFFMESTSIEYVVQVRVELTQFLRY